MSDERLGAQAFLEQLVACGVRWIFGNPGTTEQTVIDYLQDYEDIDLVLALHEGVAVGAADGYARATGDVGVVELHAGPGLGNGIGTIYNAFISHTPMIVYVGQSEQRALYQEPVLTADLVGMAEPVTKWAYEVRTADEIPQVVRRAFQVATTPPCGPVLLSIPLDLTDAPCTAPVVPMRATRSAVRPDPAAIDEARRVIAGASAPVLLVGDGVATSGAVADVGRLAALLGAPILEGAAFETVVAPDDPHDAGRLPGDPAAAGRALEPYDVVVAIGTRVLAQVFPAAGPPLGAHPLVHIGPDPWELGKNQPGTLVLGDERAAVLDLTPLLEPNPARDAEVIEHLADTRAARLAADARHPAHRVFAELGAALPDDVCVVDESMSYYDLATRHLPRRVGSWFRGAGGIGMGLPRALGVQLAHPDRPVVAVVGDGAAMYSLTALWTAAHHELPVVWVILNNGAYRTLKQNTLKGRTPQAADHVFVGADLTDPDVDFLAVAEGFGVRAIRVDDPADIATAVHAALSSGAPALIDLVVDGQL
ncbi:MAG TPA: thiamine pyrophosphate-binding protein [Pseudonocardiaceae bacterium]|jgi:benzoylformate decarboxylase|nr:thiamine pyrophosphate-binding protein [Pseudonocardiaceae bacterium]